MEKVVLTLAHLLGAMLDCSSVTPDAKRLACYDAAAKATQMRAAKPQDDAESKILNMLRRPKP